MVELLRIITFLLVKKNSVISFESTLSDKKYYKV